MKEFSSHFEKSVAVNAQPDVVFAYADDHRNFSAHMNKSSLMMGGGSMHTDTDEGRGQRVGSHIKMSGKVLGIKLSLDEVVTVHNPPRKKEWETVGEVNLIVIDHYRLGFEIKPSNDKSDLRVYIDYDQPKTWKTKLMGKIFEGMYARWCVDQMVNGVQQHFNNPQVEK